MIQVRCPQCSTSLALKQAPPSGKVKCPKCAAIVEVKPSTAAAGAARRPAGPAGTPLPTGASPAGTASRGSSPFDGDIDFRSIPVPTSASPSGYFPMLGPARVYDGPIQLDPLPEEKPAEATKEKDHGSVHLIDAQPQPEKPKGKKANQKTVIIGLVAVVLLACVGGGAYFLLGGGGGSGAPDLVASAAAAAPSGFQAKGLHNCIVLMPQGSWGEGKAIPSAIDSEVVMSDKTTSVFLLAAMDGGSQPIDNEQMRKKASRSLGGDILGGTPVERNGYKGIKGILDGSVFLPRMQIEAFHHDGRFVIIGHALGSAMRSAAGGEAAVVGGNADEAQEVEVFLNSFKIGPPPSGFFGN